MEFDIKNDNKNSFMAEIHGVGHAFTNALKNELWNDKEISIAAYNVEHPLVGVPKLIVEMKRGGKSSREAVVKAVDRLKKHNKEFTKKFKKLK